MVFPKSLHLPLYHKKLRNNLKIPKAIEYTYPTALLTRDKIMEKQRKKKLFSRWHSKQLLKVSLFGIYTVFALEIGSSNAAPASRLEDWRFYPEGLQLEITLSAPSQPRYFYLSQPPRIVIDLPGTKLGYVSTQQNYSGAIKSIRVSQLNADVTRIVMDLVPGTFVDPNQVQLQPVSWQNPTRWVIRPITGGNNTSLGPVNSLPSGNQPSTPGLYNPPPPSGNQPLNPGFYNQSQPPSNLPPTPGFYNQPQPPSNLPPSPGFYNQSQPPSNLPPANSNSSQPPLVTVPPLSPNNPSQPPNSVLPPATFPNQPGNPNGIPFFPTPNSPNYPVSTPNNQSTYPNSGAIEFGQPLPNPTR
jgi:hypothetical protein